MTCASRLPAGLRSELEGKLLSALSLAELRRHLEWFDRLGLRLGGTEREREAVAYVLTQLRAAGIDCEEHEFDAFVSYAEDSASFGPASVVVLDEPIGQIPAKIYAFTGSTPPEGVIGTVVDVGVGASGDYEGIDVRGRIALSRLSFDCPHSEPARVAQLHGAAALIVSNWSDRDGSRIHTSTAKWAWGNPTPRDLREAVASIPVVAISAAAGDRLRHRLRERPLRAAVVANASRQWVRALQPIAHVHGQTDDFLLLHCHVDSFGHGVTDNATGIAGLLELARVLHENRARLRRSVRLAWWACHEMPYDGSTAYLDSHWEEFKERCVVTLNADSWAITGSAGRLVGLSFAELEHVVDAAIRDAVGRPPFRLADFGAKEAEQSFWSIGIPSLFVFSASPDFPSGPLTGTWFHTEFDGIEHVDEGALKQLVATYALLSVRLATVERLPFSYLRVAERLASWIDELRPLAAPDVELDALAASVARLAAAAKRVELSSVRAAKLNIALIRVGRHLNPVIYSVAGPYVQDPVAVEYVSRRLPGLRRALEGLARAENELTRHAWVTQAVRDRNRVADAVMAATDVLESATQAL